MNTTIKITVENADKIPFPCWLFDANPASLQKPAFWFWAEDRSEGTGDITYYSTSPTKPEGGPEDASPFSEEGARQAVLRPKCEPLPSGFTPPAWAVKAARETCTAVMSLVSEVLKGEKYYEDIASELPLILADFLRRTRHFQQAGAPVNYLEAARQRATSAPAPSDAATVARETQYIDSREHQLADALDRENRELKATIAQLVAEQTELNRLIKIEHEGRAAALREVERLQVALGKERDAVARANKPWQVELAFPANEDPFNRVDCKVIDIGHADRILIVECPDVAKMAKELNIITADRNGLMEVNERHRKELAQAQAKLAAPASGPSDGVLTQIPWNEQTEDILGRMCFECRDYARLLEQKGLYPAKTKAEHEQAIVIHFMLNLYLKHGENWRKEGAKILFPDAALSAPGQKTEGGRT